MSDWEMWFIDALSELPGMCIIEWLELGELSYFHAVFAFMGDLFELDIITQFMDGWDEKAVVDEFVSRIREVTYFYEA